MLPHDIAKIELSNINITATCRLVDLCENIARNVITSPVCIHVKCTCQHFRDKSSTPTGKNIETLFLHAEPSEFLPKLQKAPVTIKSIVGKAFEML